MSSWRSSNVDEMVRAAFAEERLPPPPKEGERRRVSSVVDLAVVRCGLPPAGGAPRSGAVVGVVADDDGVVPGCPGGGHHSRRSCHSMLQTMASSRILWSGRTSPMESVARRPQ